MSDVQLFQYRLPLVAPITIGSGNRTLTLREGLLIRRRQEAGPDAWGEAAPLAGYSIETLPEVIQAARRQQWDRFACLQFAHASLDLEPAQGRLPISVLLMDDVSSAPDEIARVADLPHGAVKLKVARGGPLGEEIALVHELQRALRPDQRLRLDANGRWTYDQALEFCQAVADGGVEYLEEPTGNSADFERLSQATGVPYALDESLRRPIALSDFPHAAALIIKPTLLGGPNQLQRFAARGIPCVFSAAFESGIGIGNIARLAHQWPTSHPVGLDTYRRLADDVLRPRWSLEDGTLDLSKPGHVDLSKLEELSL